MGRKPRPSHAGTFHVASRSIAQERIFRDDRDYVALVHELALLVRGGWLACHGFCVMPTHYHLIATFEDEKLAASVQRLNRRYAGGFNRRHARRGHVFDSPYTSVEITDPDHDAWLDVYVAENPPRRPWPWSSYDAGFDFVTPRPWQVAARVPGSAALNQVRV